MGTSGIANKTSSRRASARLVFYRDLFLFWPLLLTTWVAGAFLFGPHSADETRKGLICAAVAVATLLLVRRRLALLLAMVAFVASLMVRRGWRTVDWRVNVCVFVVGVLLLVLVRQLHESKSLRRLIRDDLHEFVTDEPTMTTLIVGLAGLLTAFVVLFLVSR